MAKTPRDGAADRLGRAPEAPAPAARLALTTDEKFGILADALLGMQQALASLTLDRDLYLGEERRQEENLKRVRAECEKTAQQRTQERADREWPEGAARFRVCLMAKPALAADPDHPGKRRLMAIPDGAFPLVEVNAHSADEARQRYLTVCHISSTEHEVRATPVGQQAGGIQANTGPADEWDALERAHSAGEASLAAAGVESI